MSIYNRVGRNIEAEKWELEATIEMKIDEIKSYHVKNIYYLDMKISDITSKKPSSSYEQTSAHITKFPLLKSPEKSSHASKLTKRISSMNLAGNTLLQLQKFWYAIRFSFC